MDEPRAASVAPRSAFREVAGRLVRTRAARFALGLLALLYSAAIFAPLIANDRPYALEAVDMGGYDSARVSLAAVTRSLASLSNDGEAQYLARRAPNTDLSFNAAIARERSALRVRTQALRRSLKSSDETLVDRFDAEVENALRAPTDSSTRFDASIALATQIGTELVAIDPRTPGVGRVELESQRSYPLFASLVALDVFCMTFAVCVVVARAWRAVARRNAKSAWRVQLLWTTLVALLVTLAWQPVFGGVDVLSNGAIKEAIRTGDLRVVRVQFPPIAMGYAETNLSEAFRPPTWTAASEMKPEGGYARATSATGTQASTSKPMPVRVGEFEPALNAWWRHLLGTDSVGRDLFARLLWGARVSLTVGLLSAIFLTLIGTILGLIAGWFGGRIDFVISRTIEIVLCFPAFVLVLCALFFVDPRVVQPIFAVAFVIAFVGWTGVARLVRAECAKLRELEFVAAARALGLSTPTILARHVLPNAIGPVIVAFAFAVGGGMLTESALSFLGFGVEVPVPSWGSLVGDSKTSDHWWIWLAPGVCIFATVVAYNLAGDALRDALDPRRRDG